MRVRRSRLTDEQTRRLLEHFVAGTPARTAAELVQVNRNTARLFYHKVREIIAQRLESENPMPGGVEVDPSLDESAQDDRGQVQDAPKIPVFALIRRGEKIFTVMVTDPNRPAPPLQKARVRPDSIIYAESPDAQQALDVSDLHHQPVPRRARLVNGRANITSTENFWNQAKRHLRRYNGVPRQHFHLFLKECEWRFNYGPPKALLRILKYWIRRDSRRSSSMPGR